MCFAEMEIPLTQYEWGDILENNCRNFVDYESNRVQNDYANVKAKRYI